MKKLGQIASGSSLALALALGSWGVAEAQPAPAAPAAKDTEAKKAPASNDIVITGTFIRGTPEDSAIPVNAITLKDLQNIGSPSNMDLVKGMTDVGASRGEGDRRGGGSTVGAQTINLREMGAERTLVLLNGRRLPDQITVGARFNNIAVIPNNVLGRVDTLRDGGAVTYGSDAIAGVVNFITRHDFNGLRAASHYRAIDKSDGDWDADVLWGAANDVGNLMLSAQYQRKSTLMAKDRDFAMHQYYQNNNSLAWTPLGSPGTFSLNTTLSGTTGRLGTPLTPTGAGALGYNVANSPDGAPGFLRQMSSTGVLRDPGCRTNVDAYPGWSGTTPTCYYHYTTYDKLHEEQDEYTVYGEANYDINDHLKYHAEVGYYKLTVPDAVNTPSDAGGSAPQILCTGAGTSTIGLYAACTTKGQFVGALANFQVPGSNPYVSDMLNKLTSALGGQTLSNAQKTSIINTGGIAFSSWRPFGSFGNPLTNSYDTQRNVNDQIRITQEFTGDLPKLFGIGLNWEAATTFTHNVQTIFAHDIVSDRLQLALNGFGGSKCINPVLGLTTTTVPGTGNLGTGNCYYLNPFSSAYGSNPQTGGSNLVSQGGTYNDNGLIPTTTTNLANPYDVISWLYVPIKYERDYTNVLADLKFDGDLPITLPGGNIAVAFGGQFRYEKDLFTLDDYTNQKISPCTAPRDTTCVTVGGLSAGSPLQGNRGVNIFGTTQESKRYYPAWSVFAETQLPITDNLNADFAMRYERFISDTSTKDNAVLAPQASIKWQALDWFALRGTAGKTFANTVQPEANPASYFRSTTALSGGTIGGTQAYTNLTDPNFDVRPETGFNYSYGALFKVGSHLSLKADYYNIKITDLARPAIGPASIVAGATVNHLATDGSLINCSSGLIAPGSTTNIEQSPFFLIPAQGFSCVQGVSTVANFFTPTPGGTLGVIKSYPLPRAVNSGTFNTDGVDVGLDYRADSFLGGTLAINADVTKLLNWRVGDLALQGSPISAGYDGVGYTNTVASKVSGQLVSEYKANVGFNYGIGRHNFNWRTVFRSELRVDDTSLLSPVNTNVANSGANVVNGNLTAANGGACATTVAVSSFTPGANTVIPGAGFPQFGVLQTLGGQSVAGNGANSIGFCNNNNATIMGGTDKLPAYFTSDFSYRVTLPWQTVVTATVQNVFDVDPGFYRASESYASFLESPLGRSVRVGLEKKF